jgi:hypothetical protein
MTKGVLASMVRGGMGISLGSSTEREAVALVGRLVGLARRGEGMGSFFFLAVAWGVVLTTAGVVVGGGCGVAARKRRLVVIAARENKKSV